MPRILPISVAADFPFLGSRPDGRRTVYLDSASTSQKPRQVIDAVAKFSAEGVAAPHRSVHAMGERASRALEEARIKVQRFIGAADPAEVIFVRGATEAINLVARTHGRLRVGLGDDVIIGALEHHSNILPWQALCREAGARLRVIPSDGRGDLVLEEYEKLLGPRTRMVAIAHVSGATGTVIPVEAIVRRAHASGATVLVDGALGAPHLPVDVRKIGCDFYAFSGHKLHGPSGIGVLHGRASLLEEMPPWQLGGDMVRSVSFEKSSPGPLPGKFEAGMPNLEGAVGLGAAIDYLTALGMPSVEAHEKALLDHAAARLADLPGVRLLARPSRRAAAITLVAEGAHPHDLATLLDQDGIQVRAGHHCSQPFLESLGIPASLRISVGVHNTIEDLDALAASLERALAMLR